MSKFTSYSVSQSKDDGSTASNLQLYYCLCGEFILVIDTPIDTLPKRPVDRSRVIDCAKRSFKLNAALQAGDGVLVEREGGHERQNEFNCPRCVLPVLYQSTPPPIRSGPYIYILAGALTQRQGQIPPDAFDGENEH
ncbi:hypothetical protein DL96DRAFT_1592981 [Flagelloscypha sp. PMI_526]|nr:hypothetical protein DL96DRAFT_1592981 [Flagelloscypha sp. PMI_526]